MKNVFAALAATVGSIGISSAADSEAIQYLNSGQVLPATLPLSEAVRVGRTLYLSGQIGLEPGSMRLVAGGIRAESRQTMQNIQRVLEAHGYSMRDVIKCTVLLADISEWNTFNETYRAFFTERFPARTAAGVNGLALGARVEVECVAVLQK